MPSGSRPKRATQVLGPVLLLGHLTVDELERPNPAHHPVAVEVGSRQFGYFCTSVHVPTGDRQPDLVAVCDHW